MASRAVMADRTTFAYRMLLQGRSSSAVVTELSERWGISARQGRRIVGRAYEQLKSDFEDSGTDMVALTAQTVHLLQEGAAKALQYNNVSAMVGCVKELNKLILYASKRRHGHHA